MLKDDDPGVGPGLDTGVPKELWYVGLAASALLIVAGLSVMALVNVLYGIGALAACIGFGIALATFGTKVGGTFLKFNIVGGGAMAVALYLLLNISPMSPTARYLVGEIYQTGKLKEVRGRAKHVFLTGRSAENGDFRFVVFENEIGDGLVKFNFDFPAGDTQREFSINCIEAKTFKAALQKREPLAFSLEEPAAGRFRLIETGSNREVGRLNDSSCAAPANKPRVGDEVGFLDLFSMAAHAQQAPSLDIPKALAQLEADDGDARDRAREQLALLRGDAAYQAVTNSWKIDSSSYRADLGRLVAWSAAIGQDRSTAVTLANALSAPQLRYLVQLTGQGDFTLRQIATEVLHRLIETTSWANGPPKARALEVIGAATSVLAPTAPETVRKPGVQFSAENMIYNTLVALGFAECNIGAVYRPGVIAALQDFAERGKNNAALAKSVGKASKNLATLQACPA